MRELLKVFVVAFALNLVWENAQAPLYQGYVSFWQHFWICLPASLWDAGYITVVYLAIKFAYRAVGLIQKTPDQEESVFGITTMIIVVALGFVTAGYIELRALAQGRWTYTDVMPLVPIIHVGLTPFLQLALLSLLTYTIVTWYAQRKKATHPPHL